MLIENNKLLFKFRMSINFSIRKLLISCHYGQILQRINSKISARNFSKSQKLQDCQEALSNNCQNKFGNLMTVSCKVAIVNGGSSGIGLAAAHQLLNSGAKSVAITGHNGCQGKEAVHFLNNKFGMGRATFINCNVNSMGEFEDAFKKTVEMYKRLDIVVNAVGICDGEKWEREVVTNIVGTIRGTLLAYRYVGKEGFGKGGCVVNISGVNGLEALPSAPTLSASQHAIVGLSRSFGNEVHSKKSGVRVVCLCPGFTKTNFIKNISEKGMTSVLGQHLESAINNSPVQKADVCGHAVVHTIQHGANGSVWLCEGSRLFIVNIPSKNAFSTLVAHYT